MMGCHHADRGCLCYLAESRLAMGFVSQKWVGLAKDLSPAVLLGAASAEFFLWER